MLHFTEKQWSLCNSKCLYELNLIVYSTASDITLKRIEIIVVVIVNYVFRKSVIRISLADILIYLMPFCEMALK